MMKFINVSLIALASISLISLGACSSNPAAKTENTPTSSTPVATTEPINKAEEKHTEGDGHKDGEKHVGGDAHKDGTKHVEGDGHKDEHSGQVVQVGKYHVEFKPDPDKNAIHLGTVLHDDKDTQIVDAKLIAQVQLPDGTSKTLPLAYNTGEKQYTATLPMTKAGDYKVVMQVDVKGDKFNSRFSFKK
jgi:hypothetical protein